MTSMLSEPAAAGLSRPGPEPIAVEVTRGTIVESRHAVDAAVVDADGRLVAAWGEVERPVYPRSAVKPIQALALVETGAADAFGLGDKELALAAASHLGRPAHVRAVRAWLARIGLSEADLECGVEAPAELSEFADLVRAGQAPAPANHNCSGKHTGMLSQAVHLGEATAGYVAPAHPVQRRVAAALAEMAGVALERAPRGIDGCSVPTYAVPLRALALAVARLTNPEALAPARAAACLRITAAMWAAPEMVAGEGNHTTALLRAGAGRIVVKTGAEGVYVAGLAGRGLGLALKARDGATRPRPVALLALLQHLGALDDAARAELAAIARPPVLSLRGAEVGELHVAPWRSWSSF